MIIEGGPMMWMSFTMGWNRQEGKWLIVDHKALKWVNANSAPTIGHLGGFPWQKGW